VKTGRADDTSRNEPSNNSLSFFQAERELRTVVDCNKLFKYGSMTVNCFFESFVSRENKRNKKSWT